MDENPYDPPKAETKDRARRASGQRSALAVYDTMLLLLFLAAVVAMAILVCGGMFMPV